MTISFYGFKSDLSLMGMLTKSQIMEILNDWNYWKKDFNEYHRRPKYQSKIELFRDSGEIIVLTGIRRSGKSTLLKMEMESLSEIVERKCLLYVNFEDLRLSNAQNDDLLSLIFTVYRENINPEGEVYLFLDEVQNVSGWEKWVYTLHELNKAKIYVTGSSSKMLSGEIATALSGRHLCIEIYPLTFLEYISFKGVVCTDLPDYTSQKIEINRLFNEYLEFGGFPKIANMKAELKHEDLISYFNTILIKDIVGRHGFDYSKLETLTYYLLSNDTKQNNINSISKALGFNYATVESYVNALKEVYMLFDIRNYNYSLKKQIKSDNKFYSVDTGFVNAVSFKFSDNVGRLYENVVFNELKRRGKEIFFLNDSGCECDFIIKERDEIKGAFQVCYSLNNSNQQREINGLIAACKKFGINRGYIITESRSELMNLKGLEIEVVPITEFLLCRDL
ncbi:ATP-binding protein [Methanomicrobium antiquum]|uniref:ATP-binding protein n=1 Tax=Methanomicrobium antiquum TaxID=487686 RepID=A0AAF0JMG8_9EURY|nr:ATP-binding protein [Methanomicrobium antiquum]WFN36416.1 ATP-binding protein [Methanomicrobium antiquum]